MKISKRLKGLLRIKRVVYICLLIKWKKIITKQYNYSAIKRKFCKTVYRSDTVISNLKSIITQIFINFTV